MQHLDEGAIHSWLDGALSGDEAARVEAHVKECPQCAAAVAEARGFIAGASRILTALDNAPRGVIPVAAPKKRFDPLIWRVAATVLVVASASLLLFRDGGREAHNAITNVDTVSSTAASGAVAGVAPAAPDRDEDGRTTTEPAPPIIIRGNPSRRPAIAGSQPGARATEKSTAKVAAADTPTRVQTLAGAAPGVAYSEKAPSGAPQPNAPVGENKPVQRNDAAVGNIPSSSGYAGAVTATPLAAASQVPSSTLKLRGVMSLDATRDQLKVVGTPRTFGAKVTLYEVAPGDTVTLREDLSLSLSAVVVTGAQTKEPRQSVEKSAATERAKRADTAVVSAADSPRPAEALRSPVRAPSVAAPISRVDVAGGMTTIIWVDATTGNTLRLSGRMPEGRLRQIKIRIEQERAAAAAKQNP